MGVRQLAIGVALAALTVTGCGSNEPSPVKEVPLPATTTSSAPTTTATQPAGDSLQVTVAQLGPRYNRAFRQLIDTLGALSSGADAVTSAAADAQRLVDRTAAGYTPPSGSAPQVARLRDALGSFGSVLHTVLTSNTLLPQLAAQLQVRSAQLAKRRPRSAAALLTAKQRVDAAIADGSALDRAIAVTRAKVGRQLSNVSVDGNALGAAVATAGDSATTAIAKVSEAVDGGLQALVAAG